MQIGKLFISLALCFLVAYIGSLITLPSITTWYLTLNKPLFTPPNWLFGPVWTLLYFMIAISFYLIWKEKKGNRKQGAFKFFLIQLCLNFLWSLVFFGFHSQALGLITIVALWVFIFLTIRSFYKLSKKAAYLLVPYLFWVSFATVLNFFIVILN